MRRIVPFVLALLLPGSVAFGQVVGGADAPVGKWDDAAAVFFGGGGPGCTGVLIAPNVALTAGHCIGGISRITVGQNDLNGPGESIQVVKEIEYPNSFRNYDIGVLVLETDATTVEPRTIASGCVRDQWLEDGAEVVIVGYGATNTNGTGSSDILQEAYTTITDHDCAPASNGCNSSVSPDGELTAGGMGIDSCFGDSGGPLYLVTPRGDFLVGITSRGVQAGGQPCGQGGIYGRPDAIVDWIEEQTGVELPDPICNFAPEPSALSIEVVAGESESTRVAPNDQDSGDSHTFAVAGAPELGTVEVDADGVATYTADGDYEGPDAFTIAVTDDGAPEQTGQVVVAVTVLPGSDDCGCRSSRGGDSGWLIALAVLGVTISSSRRRRRGAAGRS